MAIDDDAGGEASAPAPGEDLPFPDSLCHGCAAPPRYVRAARSTFIMCPILPNKYPRQPVRACELYRPRPAPPGGDGPAKP